MISSSTVNWITISVLILAIAIMILSTRQNKQEPYAQPACRKYKDNTNPFCYSGASGATGAIREDCNKRVCSGDWKATGKTRKIGSETFNEYEAVDALPH